MGKNPFPNFTQAILLVFVYLILSAINDVIWWETKNIDNAYVFDVIRRYINIILLLVISLFVFKKTNQKLSDYYIVPDFLTIIRFIIIVMIARFVISLPFDKPIQFFTYICEFKLKLINPTSDRPIFFFYDLRLIVIVPIVEEIFFRGLLLKQFLKQYTHIKAILLSSLIFGFYHLHLENFIFYSVLGILFATIYFKTNSLFVVIMAHMIWNLISNFSSFKFVHLSTVHAVLFVLVYLISIWAVVYLFRRPLVRNNMVEIGDEMS